MTGMPAMMLSDIAAALTSEEMLTKDTGGDAPPSRDAIARLAYQFYDMRGRQDGHDVEDWVMAERELAELYRDYRHYQ
jgi:Protein of unknown function (DUF2934)